MKTIVQNFNYRDKNYTIVNDGTFYMTVENKFIDKQGRINKELHYHDGLHTAKTLAECIKDTQNDLDMQYHKANGMTEAEAFAEVFDAWEQIDELRRLFD